MTKIKKTHSFGLVETDRDYVISYYLGSFRDGDHLKSLVDKVTGESTTWKSITIDQLEVDLLLIGKSKSDELIFTLNSEQLERMTPAQIQVLSKKLKTPIDQNKPLLIFFVLQSEGLTLPDQAFYWDVEDLSQDWIINQMFHLEKGDL